MKCDRRLLSDYLDGELSGDLEREVAEHLASCESCRQLVQEYRWIGRELRQMPRQPVPAIVEARIRARLAEPRQSRLSAFLESLAARPLIPALGTVAATLLVVLAVGFQQARLEDQARLAEPAVVARVPENGSTGVVLNEVIEFTFDRPIDATAADWEVMIYPSANVDARVIGNKVELRPIDPLKPDTTYTVVVQQKKASSGVAPITQSPPARISFSTGMQLAEASPVASPTPKRTPTAVPTVEKPPTSTVAPAIAPATSTPTAGRPSPTSVPPSQTAVPKPSPTVPLEACMSDVSPSIVRLLRAYPDADRRLVCAVEPAETSTVAEQRFGRGVLLTVGGNVYVLLDGADSAQQTWSRYDAKRQLKPATPTPAVTATPSITPSPVAPTPVAPTPTITAAATPTVDPSETPTDGPADTPSLTPTATPALTPAPTAATKSAATPAAAASATPQVPPLGKEAKRFLEGSPDVAAMLGKPTTAEVSRRAAVQELAKGIVLSYGGEVGYVLYLDGHWERVVAVPPTPAAQPTLQPALSPSPTVSRPAGTALPTPATATPTPRAGG